MHLQKSHEDPLVITANIITNTLGHRFAITLLEGLSDHLKLRTLICNEARDKIEIISTSTINSILDTSGKVHIRSSDKSKHGISEVAAGFRLDGMLQDPYEHDDSSDQST